jgi:hypothetical protein
VNAGTPDPRRFRWRAAFRSRDFRVTRSSQHINFSLHFATFGLVVIRLQAVSQPPNSLEIRMSLKKSLSTLIIGFLTFGASSAWATTICSSNVVLLAYSQTDPASDAHLIQVNGGSGYCSTACTVSGTYRMYVEFGDKQLYAQVLAASENGGQYNLAFDPSADSMGNGVHGFITCKLLSIWK